LATDLHDLFQANYNHIEIRPNEFNRVVDYKGTPAGQEVWALVSRLDTAKPDEDSRRLGALARLSMRADSLFHEAENAHNLNSDEYLHAQRELMQQADILVSQSKDDE
jgi:hypothetical protein